jgi:glycine/D-amino acid oxidase-like deaminating enzyme
VGGWCMFDGADELYCIRRADGRICLGGARSLEPDSAVGSTDDNSLSAVVGEHLRSFLHKRFPQLETGGKPVQIEAEWTGVLGFTTDGYPVVGEVEGRQGVIVAAGYCGHGMPQCFGVGKGVAQMIGHAMRQELGATNGEDVYKSPVPGLDLYIRDKCAPSRFLRRQPGAAAEAAGPCSGI